MCSTRDHGLDSHEKFLEVYLITCQSHLTECSHKGKANLPENAASAKQFQEDAVAIGNPERHARKASHRGSKQQ